MSLNNIVLEGKVPNFESTYKVGEGDKKSFYSNSISVKRDFKKEDEKYYPEDLIRIKAFGTTADFLAKFFDKGAGITITGRLCKDDDYEDKDGNSQKGQYYVSVEHAYFPEAGNKKDNTSEESAKSEKPAKPSAFASKPAAKKESPFPRKK